MINLNCCHLALVLAVANIVTLAIFAGYTVKLRERQFILERRNGKELKAITELKARVEELEQNNESKK
jgi:hypothetical protein